MNLLDYLRKAAKSSTSVYTTFLQQYNKNDTSLHIFHEGKDDPSFYGNFIQNKTKKSRKVYYYQARNKDKVYENYQKINWKAYSKKRILFLVDKDFSDILKINYPIDSNIFVTSFYSIENYLVDNSTFSRSLRELMGLDNDKTINRITKQFQIGIKTFYETSLILTAYILYHRLKNNPLNLKDINLSDLFRIDNNFIVTRKPKILSQLDKKTGVVTKNAYSDIKSIIVKLKKINSPKKYTRGKFELSYMVSCINLTPDIVNYGKQKGDKKYKLSVQMSSSNSIAILAPRIREPKDLRIFLARSMK